MRRIPHPRVSVWSVKMGETGALSVKYSGFQRCHLCGVVSVSFGSSDSMLAAGGLDSKINLCNILDYDEPTMVLEGHSDAVRVVSFSASGDVLVSGSDDCTIKLWNAETGGLIKTLEGHSDRVWSVSLSPSGDVLASGSDDGFVKLWNVETGEPTSTLELGFEVFDLQLRPSLWFSPSGDVLAWMTLEYDYDHYAYRLGKSNRDPNNQGLVKLCHVEMGKSIEALKRHSHPVVSSVLFSHSGDLLCIYSGDLFA